MIQDRAYYTAKYERSKLVYFQFIASQSGETAQVKEYQAKIDALNTAIETFEKQDTASKHLAETGK